MFFPHHDRDAANHLSDLVRAAPLLHSGTHLHALSSHPCVFSFAGAAADKAELNNTFVSATGKRLRALNKKLREAEELRTDKAANGRTLDASQEAKVASLPALEASVQELTKLHEALMVAFEEDEKEKIAAAAAAAAEAQSLRNATARVEAELAIAQQQLARERAAHQAALASLPTVPMIEVATANADKAAAAAAAAQAASEAAKATVASQWSNVRFCACRLFSSNLGWYASTLTTLVCLFYFCAVGQKLSVFMQLLHFAHLTADANPHADANTAIITEHFGGAVSAAELAAVRHLVALLDGSAPSFGDALYVYMFCFRFC